MNFACADRRRTVAKDDARVTTDSAEAPVGWPDARRVFPCAGERETMAEQQKKQKRWDDKVVVVLTMILIA
jgi:hypothetical protein